MLNSLKYRPDLDGLRALAVIAVIIFHCYSFAIPSGYVGVDIFFVISGFLITKIILKDQQLGNFSFAKFYLRRIRRIFPALFFMLFCSFILAFLTLPSGDMLWFSRGFYYASLQISNLFFQRGVDYFNEERNFEPLLHTWSLGVEEQFYLLTPFILLSLFRLTENKILDDEDLDQYGSFIRGKHCDFSEQDADFPDIEECVIGENKKDFEVVIFGDSHAGHYSTSVVSWSEKRNMSVASLYFFACAPFLAEKTPSESATKCSEYREKVLQILQDKPHLKYVFLGSSWFDANKNNSPEDLEIFKNNLSKSIKAITDLNKTVIILGRVPNFNIGKNDESPLECIEQELVPLQKIFKTTSSKCTSLEIKSFAEQLKVQDLMKQEVAKYKNAFFFDPFPYFCDDVACSAVKNKNLLYADSGHLNENGSKHIAQSDFFPLEIISNKKQLGKNK
jgi:hypothetical protein